MPDTAASPALVARIDEALLAACRSGDEHAFAALARRHHAALRALARCWPGGAYEAEREVQAAWLAVLGGGAPCAAVPRATPHHATPTLRAHVAREVVAAATRRTNAPLGPPPAAQPLDPGRVFAADHELWPGEWADPPRPWGPAAGRRLGEHDMPRVLARRVRELGIGPSAALTLHDVHGWPIAECALALERSEAEVRRLLHTAREALRATLEAEVDSR